MFAWHHRLDGREFEQIVVDNGLGSLTCTGSKGLCGLWGRNGSDTTGRQNRTELMIYVGYTWNTISFKIRNTINYIH